MADFTDEPSFSPLISIPTGHVHSGVLKKRKAGRKKFKETRHPIYKGVRQRCGKWVCEMRQPDDKKSRIWLGTFTSPDMAAKAYDVAAFALKGDSASLNVANEASASTHTDQPSGCNIVKDIDDQCAYLKMAGDGFNDEVEEASRKVVYLDEEELFNMPGLIDSMAEGLILTPPAMQKGFNWDAYDDLANNAAEFSLWSD